MSAMFMPRSMGLAAKAPTSLKYAPSAAFDASESGGTRSPCSAKASAIATDCPPCPPMSPQPGPRSSGSFMITCSVSRASSIDVTRTAPV